MDGRQTGWSDRRTHTPDPRIRLYEKTCSWCAGAGWYMRWPQKDRYLCPRCIGVGIQLMEGEEP